MLIDGVTSEVLPASDRGLAYGDGLFETIRLSKGRPLFLAEHLERLALGCSRLLLEPDLDQLTQWLETARAAAPAEAVLKLIVTRGSGGRGYQIPAAARPRCIISIHPLPDDLAQATATGIRAFVCQQRLAWQPALAGIKHLNRLEQVLASAEFPDASYREGLMLDYSDNVIEGTRSNIFLSVDGKLLTPSLEGCGINGIMRRKVLELFGARVTSTEIRAEQLAQADEIFVVNSVAGVWPLVYLKHGARELQFQPGPYARAAADYFFEALGA